MLMFAQINASVDMYYINLPIIIYKKGNYRYFCFYI